MQSFEEPVLKMRAVEEVIRQSSPVQIPEPSTQQKLKQLCMSRVGITLIAGVAFLLTLLLLQPAYIYKKGDESGQINYITVAVIVAVGMLAVFFLPKAIT